MKHKSLHPNVKTEICLWDKSLVIYVQVIKQAYKEDGHKEKNGSYLQGVYHSFCNFCYSKQNHSGNTNTMILKWGEKKKGSRSILKSTEIFWHLNLDLISASDTTGSQLPAPPLFSKRATEFLLQHLVQLLSISQEGGLWATESAIPRWALLGSAPHSGTIKTINCGKDENNHSSNTYKTQQCKK